MDSGDQERMGEAREEMSVFLTADELRELPLLVLANKQDLPSAISTERMSEELQLHKIKDRPWSKFPPLLI